MSRFAKSYTINAQENQKIRKRENKSSQSVLKSRIQLSHKDKSVYDVLRKIGPASRQKLMDLTGIPRTSVYECLIRLREMGLIAEEIDNSRLGIRGRPRKLYHALDRLVLLKRMFISPPIDLFCVHIQNTDPSLVAQTRLEKLYDEKNELEEILIRQATFYQLCLGMGDQPIQGLFGPFPSSFPSKLAYAYSFYIPNKTLKAPRSQKKFNIVIVLIFNKDLELQLPPRRELERIFIDYLRSITEASQITNKLLISIQKQVVKVLNV